MRVIFSILFNALILYAMVYFLGMDTSKSLSEWIVVEWWIKTYLLGWIILWILNTFIKPLLKILALPLFLVFLGLVHFLINGVVLFLFDKLINEILLIEWISYHIVGWGNFIIAVAIFTILNMFYSILFSKK